MASSQPSRSLLQSSAHGASNAEGKPFFEQQREALLGEIAISFEHVLANINKLNRSMEGVIEVGNEFSSVEALWSQFENVMAKEPETERPAEDGEQEPAEEDTQAEALADRTRGGR